MPLEREGPRRWQELAAPIRLRSWPIRFIENMLTSLGNYPPL
jgi:hypothetical protein